MSTLLLDGADGQGIAVVKEVQSERLMIPFSSALSEGRFRRDAILPRADLGSTTVVSIWLGLPILQTLLQ